MSGRNGDLLALLRLNARESVSVLARKLGMSRSTVQDRIRRLEEQGTIAGYSVVLGDGDGSQGVRAFVTIAAEPQSSAALVTFLRKLPAIEALHTVSGKFDLMASLRVDTPAHLDKVLDTIGTLAGVVRTESAIILSTKFDRR